MTPDEFQQAWQADSAQTRVIIDADLLREEVQRDQRQFNTMISYRDFGEVGVAIVMIPIWFVMGYMLDLPWAWYLSVPVFLWIAGFMLLYRRRHQPEPDEAEGPLLQQCVQRSLAEVEQQIWLLKNILWWYLLPPTLSITAFFAQISWQSREGGWALALLFFVLLEGFVLALYGWIYVLNQRVVREQLLPRREELQKLRTSLEQETTDEGINGQIALPNLPFPGKIPPAPCASPVQLIVGLVLFVAILLFLVFMLAKSEEFFDSGKKESPETARAANAARETNLVAHLRQEKNLVGLAAMVMVDGQVVAAVAEGERKIGSGVMLEMSDAWHLGGITKSITATMLARLVESGQMHWTDTVGGAFPDASIHEDWKGVTLKQLLTDTAGAPVNFPKEVVMQHPAPGPALTAARREAVLDVVSEKPTYPPGDKSVYSSVGYTIAVAIAERTTGATWEELVQREVSEPLNLTGVGFGPPKSPDDTLPQPRGHRNFRNLKIPVNDKTDNTSLIGPSANIHMTLVDLCTFAMEHLRGALGKGKLLSADTFKLLHKPALNNYACGWIKQAPSKEIPYTVYWHNGSNTLWYALVAFIPEKNMVIAVTSNDGDIEQAETAAWEIVKASLKQANAIAEVLPRETFPKRSPFAAVRWEDSQPEVKVNDQWYRLIALDGIPAEEMITFSKETFGDKWQKRFEEDLVELMTRMGHPPGSTVTLEVQSLTSTEKKTLKEVRMTYANRVAIWLAAQARERDAAE